MRNSKKIKLEDTVKTDFLLISKIQPQGGISFRDEGMIRTGTGYECCLHIYKFPGKVYSSWLRTVCRIKDTVTTIDISTDDVTEVMKNINKSLKEQMVRYQYAQDFVEQYDAEQRVKEMQTLYQEISSLGEVIKLVKIRIFISDRSKAALEEKVKKLINILESNTYRAAIFLNESKNEWVSVYQSYTEQTANQFDVPGQPITTQALAIGNPFHFSSLEDPEGSYAGYTPCGGNVLFDEFTKTATRLYYNSVVFGTMGSGKSTWLKKRFDDRAARGDYVRTFDISGEFATLTKSRGGKIIKLDGTNGMLNPLEILRSGEIETVNFQRHISKVTTIYKFLVPGAEQQEITHFANLIRELYFEFDLNPELENREIQITGLPAKSYPTFGDLLNYTEKKMKTISASKYNSMEKEVAKKNLLILDNIKNTLENIVATYGSIFNGYTSLENILDEQIVTFDISTIKELEPQIFDAVIFNMVSLCWDNCVTNGQVMNDLYNKGKIKKQDIVKFLIIIDESHRWINTQKLQALDLITIYLREARKYFGGIMMASQSIRDYVPEGSSDIAINKLKTVFELTQYKFIFHQDGNALGLINTVFQNELTQSQIARIPTLEMGDNILCISGEQNLEFHVHLTDEEKQLFTGGI